MQCNSSSGLFFKHSALGFDIQKTVVVEGESECRGSIILRNAGVSRMPES